ncbi:MAG: DNA adenine methylase [Halovenus sp.]
MTDADDYSDVPDNHVSVFPWPGGKGRRSDWIIERMPPHDTYVEVFGGSAAILYNKPRSHNEVYNDVNDDLVQFFEVLRDRPDDLAAWVRNVPYARRLYSRWAEAFVDGYRPDDPIERAGRFWCLRYMQFAAKPYEKSGFKVRNYWNPARTFDNAKDRLQELADRFKAVTIENRDFERILEGYDAAWDDSDEPDVLFYLDPPYMGTEHYYSLEFDHDRFVEALADVDGRWMCSYSDLPDGLAGEYYVLSRTRRHRMTRSNASEATERLVCNFDPSESGQFLASGVQETLSSAIDDGRPNTETPHPPAGGGDA